MKKLGMAIMMLSIALTPVYATEKMSEEKINWVLKNSDKSNTIANNALNDFNSLYNEETSYNQLVGIYKEVITNYKR